VHAHPPSHRWVGCLSVESFETRAEKADLQYAIDKDSLFKNEAQPLMA
jgi:hypothetical protein